jgi:hypothetical protein
MSNKILLWIKTNCILLSIFISVVLLIFVQSYFIGVYISPDSINYLKSAQALRDGYGFRVNTAAGDMGSYFSIWPIGYPVMIAFISLITNTEIYLASKILSVIILAIIFTMVYTKFKKNAWLYAFIAVNYGFLQIFYYTWSEQPFILGLIWISFAAISILNSRGIRYSHYINICLASLFLFLSRYIGAFSIGVIGLMAIYYFTIGISKKSTENIKKAGLLISTMVIVSAVVILYLLNNLEHSGFLTGMARRPISENTFILFLILCKAQIIEMQNTFSVFFMMSYGIVCVVYIICAIIIFRFLYIKQSTFYEFIPRPAFSFFTIGLLYWFSIVAMRFSASFDLFSYRLLFPASALFIFGIITIIENRYSELIKKINKGLRTYIVSTIIVLSLFSPLLDPLYNVVIKRESIAGYQKIRSDIIEDLLDIPAHSLVIINSGYRVGSYSNFIRSDLFVKELRLQSADEVFSIVEQSKEVYLYFDWDLVSDEIKTDLKSRYNDISTLEKLIRIQHLTCSH